MHCYEDNRFLKIFSDILRLMYDAEIVGEDTIQHWCVWGGDEGSWGWVCLGVHAGIDMIPLVRSIAVGCLFEMFDWNCNL